MTDIEVPSRCKVTYVSNKFQSIGVHGVRELIRDEIKGH